MNLSTNLNENIQQAHKLLPIGTSFDLITRDLFLGSTKAFWLGINGFCQNSSIQKIFSDLQNPVYMEDTTVENIQKYMNSKIGYAQVELATDWNVILKNLLSGPSVLIIDGFSEAIILDARQYPNRSIEEPDTEKVTQGARDGFVETVLFNTNLIRRRIRNPKLTFEMHSIGSDSKTDVAVAYVNGLVDDDLLEHLNQILSSLKITSLTMGVKSLEELIVKKRWYNPLPCMQITERPDVACSYLMEGHLLVLVDNSPTALILPCTIFQFTQSPEDYYKNPTVSNYSRLIRFVCILTSLFLMPVFLLIGAYLPRVSDKLNLLSTGSVGSVQLFGYVIFIEVGLDLFKYSSAHSSSKFSGSLSIVGGLILSDVAISLNWASLEVIFYAAITLLTTLALPSIDFGDALRVYRLLLIFSTGFFGVYGFIIGTVLIIISIITTPTFAHKSYFWPLYPFNWDALKKLLFRYPTAKAQPSAVWSRKPTKKTPQ